jgi:apolipoprotein N-acyltransferase
LSPELVTQSVRAGGELLVNLSDLAWFHNSMIGQQMIAFSILRAIENRRYFVFAANSGPSAIIEPTGKVIAASPKSSKATLTARVGFSSTITPFTYWFH